MKQATDGQLFVVPTPVGNLGDFTLRAIETLKNVAVIYAEDTRTSGHLMKKYEIQAPLKPYHAFNEHKQLEQIVESVRNGQSIALISDAGTPGISDPGYLLIRSLIQQNISVTCLPGPTAFVPALVMSGLTSDKFYFEGFLPHKKGRQTRLAEITQMNCTVIMYESPFRLLKCIEELIQFCGGERIACVVREISKIHEQAVTAPLNDLLLKINANEIPAKGEIVVLLSGMEKVKKKKEHKSS